MLDMLGLDAYLPFLKWAVVAFVICTAIIAAAAASFLLQTTFKPVLLVGQWLFAYTPGKPGNIAKGMSFGARVLVWAAFVGLLTWVFFG